MHLSAHSVAFDVVLESLKFWIEAYEAGYSKANCNTTYHIKSIFFPAVHNIMPPIITL